MVRGALKESKSSAFSLDGPGQLLGKLCSDAAELANTPDWNSALRAYRAIDCFLVIWHLTDWFWVRLKAEPEELDYRRSQSPQYKSLVSFKRWASEACPAVRVGQQVATAAKHVWVEKRDPGVVAEIEYERMGRLSIPKGLNVEIDGQSYDVLALIVQGRDFWARLIDEVFPRI